MRDSILKPFFYERLWPGRFRFCDNDLATQFRGIDTFVEVNPGFAISIDEKIVGWPKSDKPHSCFALETWSNTTPGHERPGWMIGAEADFLFYCFRQREEISLDCWMLDLPALQRWFWPVERLFPASKSNEHNRTLCRIVPIADVQRAIWTRRYLVSPQVIEGARRENRHHL